MIKVTVENSKSLLNVANILKEDVTPILESVSKITIMQIKMRIADGINTAGALMVTRSRKKLGRYSKKYGEERQSHGLQVSRVDLNYMGTMIHDFGIMEVSKDKVISGFSSNEQAAIAGKNEALFGDAFVPNYGEIDYAIDSFMVKIDNKFKL